ncbi:hypothetical protein HHC01_06185 [Neisseria meningitidis]|nr:hypothetical protein [Neisseria meningitidis]
MDIEGFENLKCRLKILEICSDGILNAAVPEIRYNRAPSVSHLQTFPECNNRQDNSRKTAVFL